MNQCLTCYHAEDGPNSPPHCGNCPCCKRCKAHGAVGCPLCND